MNKKIVGIILGVLIIVGGIIFYFWSQRGILKVIEVNPQNNKVIKSVTSSGSIKSKNDADMAFLATGKISSIKVEEGQIVKKGALLATLNTSSQQESLKSLQKAIETIANDKKSYKESYADNLNAVGGRENYEIEMKDYDDRIAQAEANYRSQLNVLPNYYLYAPFDGTIVDIAKSAGENITAAATLIKIADLEKLYFEVNLDQEDLENLKQDQYTEVTLDAYPNDPFKGKVTELPTFAKTDGATKEFTVKIELEKNEKPLLLGMDGDAEIVVEETPTEVTTLIFDEVYKEADGRFYIWALESGILKKSYVEIGLEGDIYTEIKSSLDNLTIVMPQNTKDKLIENQKAQIIKE